MTAEERKSILSIALHAAFVDGLKHEREREEIRSIALSLAGEAGSAELAPLYQEVLLNRVRLESATFVLTDLGMANLPMKWPFAFVMPTVAKARPSAACWRN